MSIQNNEIFIVDDDPAACAVFLSVFAHAGYYTTVFTDGKLFVPAARIRIPACVLLDISMPGRSGLDVLADLDARSYPAPVLILSGRSDIASAVEAIRGGAFDFIEKRLGSDEIVARVRASIESWALSRQLFDSESSSFPGSELLTPREREVLSQITAAASNREAAITLGISRRTVEVHRGHIMRKLGAKNTAQLLRIALKHLSRG
jgi:two-component system, LuxR family, response regulator FixJ